MLYLIKDKSYCVHWTTVVVFLFYLLCFVGFGTAVRVECKTSLAELVKRCDVGATTERSNIGLVEQDEKSNCVMNKNFFLVLNDSDSYILTMWGCSGVFDIDTPIPVAVIWGPWSPCSVSCGAGRRNRNRLCSTGNNADCTKLHEWSAVKKDCNLESCRTESKKAPSLCGISPTGYRVFGGLEADKCDFPWMAMIHKPGVAHWCGGSIVDQTHILTAAHCLSSFDARMLRSIEDKPDTLRVYTGSSVMPLSPKDDPDKIPGLLEHTVARVDVHEDFSGFNFKNDIAVITLTKPITYDRCNVPVCMIDDAMSVYDASNCVTMGWGKTDDPKTVNGSRRLQWTTLEILSEDRCQYYYGMWYQPKVFCAGGNGHDACQGDSGGPVVCKGPGNQYYQYGIVSSGFKDICGQYAGQYTHLHYYTHWLTQHLKSGNTGISSNSYKTQE